MLNVGSRPPASCETDARAHVTATPLRGLPSYSHRAFRGLPSVRNHSQSVKSRGRCRLCQTRCQANKASPDAPVSIDVSPEVGKGKTLLIIGGTGRVGSSTAASLVKTHPNLKIILGTRSQEGYHAAVKNRPELEGLQHRVLDRNNLQSILSSMEGCDMVLHTAGPFQRKKECLVLEAAIQAKIPYLGTLHMSSIQASPALCNSACCELQLCMPVVTQKLLYDTCPAAAVHLPAVICCASMSSRHAGKL